MRGAPAALVGADVAARSLRPLDAPLVPIGAGVAAGARVAGGGVVDRGAVALQRDGLRETAVGGKGCKAWIRGGDVAAADRKPDQAAADIAEEVVSSGEETGSAVRRLAATVDVPRQDRVLHVERPSGEIHAAAVADPVVVVVREVLEKGGVVHIGARHSAVP